MNLRTIKYTAKYEDLISRIPGLFAYIELDDKGNSVLHKATDSPMGCYGKVIENIEYNGKVYNYKELISLYYKNENIRDDLKNFVEKGIGKVEVKFPDLNRKKQDLVPDFVYLALVKPLYGEMLKLRDKVNFYKNHTDNRDKIDNETEESLDCVCKLYERHGGDGYLNFLGGLFLKVEAVSNEYFNYANEAINDKNRLCLNYAVNLFSTDKDMGLVTPMESLVKKPKDNIIKYIIGRGLDGKTNSKLTSLRRYEGYLNEFDRLETPPIGADWLYYYRVGAVRNISTINDENGNIRCEVTELKNISNGDIISDLYAFGDVIESIEPVGDNGIKIVYWTDVHLKATVNKKTEDDDGNYKVYYTKFEPDYPPIDDFFDENGNPTEKQIASVKWNDEKEQEECQNMTEIKFCDQNDTNNLHGIRYEEIYYFSPNEDEDNISYLLKDKVTINGKEYIVVDGKLANEYPVIEDKVTINGTEYTVVDGKVTIGVTVYTVVNGKVVIKYDVVDGKEYTIVNGKVTIKDVEYPIIKNKDFYKYVNGDYDDKQADANDAQNIKKYEKYEFSTNNNTLSYTQRVNSTDLELSCVISDYKTICIREEVNEDNSDKNNGVINGVTISRLPFYESISYTPTEKIDVFIDRGSTSVFDRHIRLSEVKTLNDMLEYSNGSYFTMQN